MLVPEYGRPVKTRQHKVRFPKYWLSENKSKPYVSKLIDQHTISLKWIL